MPEILTESFCERCGTRYTFESAAPKSGRLSRFKTISTGLKNYVLSDEASLDEALADARNDDDRRTSGEQLDAFHKTFNFCMSCRQYTCANCWNEPEGRCLTCAPHLGREILPAPFPTLEPTVGLIGAAPATNGNGHANGNGAAGPVSIDATSWPTVDLGDGASENGRTEYDIAADEAEVAPISRLEALFGAAPRVRAPGDTEPDAVVDAGPVWETHSLPETVDDEPVGVAAAEIHDTVEPEPAAPIAVSELIGASLAAAESEPPAPEPIAPAVGAAAEVIPPVAAVAPPVAAAPAAAPTRAPIDSDSLFPAHLEPAYSIEPEPLFPSHLEPAFTIESESLFPAQPAGWPASASPAAPASPTPTTPALAPAAAAASTPSVVEPAVAAAPVAEPVTAATPDVAAASPEVAEPTIVAAATPTVAGPSLSATDDLAASAASNTTVLLRRFRASRPAAGVAAVAATQATQAAQPAQLPTPAPAVAEPFNAAAVAPVEPAVEPVPTAAPAVQPAAPAAAGPAASASRPNDDRVETPVWRMVAPEGTVAPPASSAPAGATPKTNGHDRAAEPPQWPAAPQWPASPPRAAAVSGADAIWAQSSRDVLNRPESGVQACLNCGLPLSSTARFCRRCGTSQISA